MYKFIQSSVKINSNGGFSFIHCMLNANGGMKLWTSALGARHNANYPTSRIVRSMIGMMTAGECDYARIDDYNQVKTTFSVIWATAICRHRMSAPAPGQSWGNRLAGCA